MKKKLPLLLLGFWFALGSFAQGNHVFSGGEAVNFGTLDLATPGGQTWSTDRAATPGYFSAYYPGTSYTGASDAANVNGYVKKYGNEAFTFPVGTGTDLRTLSISAPSATTDEYATAWILGDPSGSLDPTSTGAAAGAHSVTSVTAPITSVSQIGQWDWQALNGTGAGLTITVSLPAGLPAGTTASDLRLVGWNGTSWVDLSGAATASGITENSTLSGTMVANISAIGIGSVLSPLPLTLVSFNAQQKDCTAALSWVTANEINTKNFEIEQSTDGVNFTKAATVAAQGNGNGKTYNYSLVQNTPLVYYRLKMSDLNGAFTYSAIVIVRTNCTGTEYFTVYPNPVSTGSGDLTLSFKVNYKGKAMLLFTNKLGQQIVNKQLTVTEGANIIHFNTNALIAGSYYITLVDANGNKIAPAQKIIKQQ